MTHHQPAPDDYVAAARSGGFAPPRRRKGRKRKILGGVIGVVVLFAVIASCSGGTQEASNPGSGSAPQATTARSVKAARIGVPVRDGKFEFVVTEKKTAKRIGTSAYLTKTAQGQFVLITVTVKNIGDKPQTFDASNQKLYDTAGHEYAASNEAPMYLGDQAKSFLEQINPANKVTGILVYDTPTSTKLDRIELHDSMFSGGANVTIS